ncbi:MAG: hypothetical protein ACI8S6_003051 [Myxococcota bacterium]|jgi:hypothetical protein
MRTSSLTALCALCALSFAPAAGAATLPISAVAAKSEEAPAEGVNYMAKNLKDSKSASVWVEGESGSGLGAWVEVDLGQVQSVEGIRLWAGVWSSPDFWRRHNRPKEVELTFDDGTTQLITLADEMKMFDIPISGGKQTRKIKVTIKSVHSGSTFNDTGISEIQVYNSAPGGSAAIASSSASSVYPGYEAAAAHDGLSDTMWCENNSGGDGVSEWLQLDLSEGRSISSVSIIAGNGSSFSMFREFNYGKAATLTFSDGSTESITLKPIPMAQKIEFRAHSTSSVRITFDEVVRGSNAEYNDLCVSEFQAE